jgi:hypothetical protein
MKPFRPRPITVDFEDGHLYGRIDARFMLRALRNRGKISTVESATEAEVQALIRRTLSSTFACRARVDH